MSDNRTLLVTERAVLSTERSAYLTHCGQTRDAYERAGIHYWLFERDDDPNRFFEFAEAKAGTTWPATVVESSASTRWHSVELPSG